MNNNKPTDKHTRETTILCEPPTRILRELKSKTQASVNIISGPQSGSFFCIQRNKELTLGSSIDSDIQISDQGVSRKHVRLFWSNDRTYTEDLQSANGSYLNGVQLEGIKSIENGDQIAIGSSTVVKFNLSNQLDAEHHQKIAQQLTRDSLTNALNKRAFIQALHQEYIFARRHSTAVCLLFIDIDYFKKINDTYGHLAGDDLLVQLYNVLLECSRGEDYVCRFGGEEFTIICRNLNTQEGLQYAQRIRSLINSSCFTYGSQSIDITASIGVSSYPEDGSESIPQLVMNADNAMYQAKNMGRNQVRAYTFKQ